MKKHIPLYGYDGICYSVGDRVEIHPSTDLWMQGARYGTVVGVSCTPKDRVRVKLDKMPSTMIFFSTANMFKKIGEKMKSKWVQFTKRTEDPKLNWLEEELARNGIKSRRKGHSFHAPILEVQQKDLDAAWKVLDPIDDIPDDDPRFVYSEKMIERR